MVYHKFKQIDIICLVGSAKSVCACAIPRITRRKLKRAHVICSQSERRYVKRSRKRHTPRLGLTDRALENHFSIAFLCSNHFAMWIRMHSNQILFMKWKTEIFCIHFLQGFENYEPILEWYSKCFIKYVSINDRFTSDIIITKRYKINSFFIICLHCHRTNHKFIEQYPLNCRRTFQKREKWMEKIHSSITMHHLFSKEISRM